jgi:hypothetical protein
MIGSVRGRVYGKPEGCANTLTPFGAFMNVMFYLKSVMILCCQLCLLVENGGMHIQGYLMLLQYIYSLPPARLLNNHCHGTQTTRAVRRSCIKWCTMARQGLCYSCLASRGQ